MQGTLVNLCYTMGNHAIATMMTYFGSTDHGLGTEVDKRVGGTSSKNRLESPLIYIYIYIFSPKNVHTFTIRLFFICLHFGGTSYIYIYINRI